MVSKQTSLFLVYLREDKEKMTELPTVQQVPQMMAAGSHGYGSVMRHTFASVAGASFAASDFCFTEDEFDIPCFVRQQPCEDTARSQTAEFVIMNDKHIQKKICP